MELKHKWVTRNCVTFEFCGVCGATRTDEREDEVCELRNTLAKVGAAYAPLDREQVAA